MAENEYKVTYNSSEEQAIESIYSKEDLESVYDELIKSVYSGLDTGRSFFNFKKSKKKSIKLKKLSTFKDSDTDIGKNGTSTTTTTTTTSRTTTSTGGY